MSVDLPTPETDAAFAANSGLVHTELAKKLERERDLARFERDRWKELADLKDARAEANRAENNRLRSELEALR